MRNSSAETVAPRGVGDSEVLFRRLSSASPVDMITIDRTSGDRRPSSAAFKPNPKRDPDGLSMYRARVLSMLDLDAEAVQNQAGDAVAALDAHTPRRLGLDVAADPQPDDDSRTPQRARAHALIAGWPTPRNAVSKLAKALASAASIVLG